MRGEGLWAESRVGGSEGGRGAAPRGEGLDAGAVSGLGWRLGRRGTGDGAWMEALLKELGGRGDQRLLFQKPPPPSLRRGVFAPPAEPLLLLCASPRGAPLSVLSGLTELGRLYLLPSPLLHGRRLPGAGLVPPQAGAT